jgi:hypothetical protein
MKTIHSTVHIPKDHCLPIYLSVSGGHLEGKPAWEAKGGKLKVANDGMSAVAWCYKGRKSMTITVTSDASSASFSG